MRTVAARRIEHPPRTAGAAYLPRHWRTILSLWLFGVLAAAQLAKMSTIAPLLQSTFGLSLPHLGLLISLLEIGGGVFGFVAGLGLGRLGCRRFLLTGLAILGAAGLVEAAATDVVVLFSARAIEGIGYLLVVVAAPTAIIALASDADRPRALALWSTFVPIGIALGGAVTSVVVGMLATRGVLLFWAVALAVGLVFAWRLPLPGGGGRRVELPAAGAWMSTFAFGLYTLLTCALLMLLPLFLIERHGASIRAAGVATACASLAAVPGSLGAMVIARHGVLRTGRFVGISAAALCGTGLLAALLFMHDVGSSPVSSATLVSTVAMALAGIVPPLMLARLPGLAGAVTADDPRIAMATGLLTQFGAGGALLGPPLGGLVVGAWGWPGLGVAVALLTGASLAAIVASERLGRAGARP